MGSVTGIQNDAENTTYLDFALAIARLAQLAEERGLVLTQQALENAVVCIAKEAKQHWDVANTAPAFPNEAGLRAPDYGAVALNARPMNRRIALAPRRRRYR